MSDDYTGHMLEQILDELRVVHEDVAGIREVVNNQPTRGEFDDLRQDVQTIKSALTATNRDVAGLDHRVSRLEAA